MRVPVTLPPSFVDPAIRANAGDADFNSSFFTIPKSGEAQGYANTGIPIVPDELFLNPGIQSEEAPHWKEVVVVVEIITLYQVQTGRFLATTGYVAPSPNHVQNNVQKRSECISTSRRIK